MAIAPDQHEVDAVGTQRANRDDTRLLPGKPTGRRQDTDRRQTASCRRPHHRQEVVNVGKASRCCDLDASIGREIFLPERPGRRPGIEDRLSWELMFWYSADGTPPPERIVTAEDTISVAAAHQLIGEGTAVLCRGDYPSARRLLAALDRRAERRHSALVQTVPGQ
ncbi:hypothetical protein OG930_42320 [Streptomyces sp. NBC_01799]|uniref:hypothetical protein n=1 Tax=Streptomyces sp. NBC_01800 TaxID=2975945 RepID=UPI002DD8C704|nr:hypothetical protein [Streptomyces sp. NBC_01800]WSA73068.1 hypothetical protein OIE65_42920 [Streptomyces sp. NBC_01800]WSA81594.1 hypothetical protein OG930_42320 [Streptomyces sp. NBC_01799]